MAEWDPPLFPRTDVDIQGCLEEAEGQRPGQRTERAPSILFFRAGIWHQGSELHQAGLESQLPAYFFVAWTAHLSIPAAQSPHL